VVSKRTYHPDRGDLIEMNFQPASGREIDKRRPAIVISDASYNRAVGLCIAVPLSTDLTPGPFWLPMPAGLLPRPSLILCDYVKSFDYRERSATFLAGVPNDLVDEIVSTLLDVIDPAPPARG
jgi:mRNA-degrading endonuclease toxin of MazEF toxin-antitoxin module